VLEFLRLLFDVVVVVCVALNVVCDATRDRIGVKARRKAGVFPFIPAFCNVDVGLTVDVADIIEGDIGEGGTTETISVLST
jgi:hypothetical protein